MFRWFRDSDDVEVQKARKMLSSKIMISLIDFVKMKWINQFMIFRFQSGGAESPNAVEFVIIK